MIKIGIDIDNVISDSYPAYLSKFNSQFKVDIRMEQIREFYFLNKYIEDNKVSHGKEMVNFVDELILDEEFQINIPPITDAQTIIKKWTEHDFQIHYITSRPVEVKQTTINWLKKHGFWVTGARIDLFDKTKGYEDDVLYKRETADKYKLDVFIEDALEIARGLDIPVFLLDRPWNQGSPRGEAGKLKKNITRVFSWQEIAELLPKVIEDL